MKTLKERLAQIEHRTEEDRRLAPAVLTDFIARLGVHLDGTPSFGTPEGAPEWALALLERSIEFNKPPAPRAYLICSDNPIDNSAGDGMMEAP